MKSNSPEFKDEGWLGSDNLIIAKAKVICPLTYMSSSGKVCHLSCLIRNKKKLTHPTMKTLETIAR